MTNQVDNIQRHVIIWMQNFISTTNNLQTRIHSLAVWPTSGTMSGRCVTNVGQRYWRGRWPPRLELLKRAQPRLLCYFGTFRIEQDPSTRYRNQTEIMIVSFLRRIQTPTNAYHRPGTLRSSWGGLNSPSPRLLHMLLNNGPTMDPSFPQ